MIRETIAATLAMAVLFGGIGLIEAATPPVPNWYFSVIQSQVPEGVPLILQVMGPPNGTFTVTLNGLPFNTSQPVFYQFYELPATSELSNGSAIGEVSVNTSLLAIEGYEVRLASANSTVFGTAIVSVTTGISAPYIDTQIEQLENGARENASRITSLLYLQGQLQTDLWYVLITAGAFFALTTFLIFATRTAAGEKRLKKHMDKVVDVFSGSRVEPGENMEGRPMRHL